MTIDEIVNTVFDNFTAIELLDLIDQLLNISIEDAKYNIENDEDIAKFNDLITAKIIIAKLLK